MNSRAGPYYWLTDATPLLSHSLQQMNLTDGLGPCPERISALLSFISGGTFALGPIGPQVGRRLRHVEEAREMVAKVGSEQMSIVLGVITGSNLLWSGDLEGARRSFGETLEPAVKAQAWWADRCRIGVALIAVARCRLE